jgi:hypothetical protein
MAGFDPDEYLKARGLLPPEDKKEEFDPDAYLKSRGITLPGVDVDPFTAAAQRTARSVKSPSKVSQPGSAINALEDRAEATGFGAGNAATFGMMNRGLGLADYLRGGSASYSEGVDKVAAHEEAVRKAFPGYHLGGSVLGGVGTGVGLARSGVGFSREGASLLQRIGMGTLEGGAFGAASGAGQTYSGNLDDYAKNAVIGGAFGLGGGAIGEGVGAAAGNIFNRVRDYRNPTFPEPVIRGARADVEGLENLPRLGPAAMLPDAGPSMQATAQQAALGIGPNRTSIVNALMERDQGTIGRLQADTAEALGPVPRVSQIREGLEANRQRINAEEYTPRLEGQVLPPQGTNAAFDQIRQLEETSRLDLSEIRDMLVQRGRGRQVNADPDPQAWLAARHRIDYLMEQARANGDNYTTATLGDARNIVDGHLAANVPGIKQADAIFQGNAIAGEELTRGGQILRTGERAVPPEDLRDIMSANAVPRGEAPPGPPSANLRLREGTRADIDRRIRTVGTDARALPKLEQTIGGPDSYNAQKLSLIFGEEPTQAVRDSVARNRQFRETYQRIVQGSDTAQRQAAAKTADISAPQMPIRNLAGTAEQVGRLGLAEVMEARKQAQREAIARILATRDPAEVARLRQALLDHIRSSAPGAAAASSTGRGALQGFGGGLGPAFEDYTR